MGFIRKFLGFVLVSVILSWSLAYAVQSRLLNFRYLESKANAGTFYTDLAKVFPQLVAHDENNNSPQAQAAIAGIISPDFLQAKFADFLDQLQAYYRDNGPAPVLDLRDVAIQARSAGLVVPPDSDLDKPIEFNDPIGLRTQYQQTRMVVTYAPFVALAILALIMMTLPAPVRYRSAGKTMLIAASSIGALWVVAKILPTLLENLIKANKDFEPITPPLVTLVQGVGADIASDFVRIFAGLLGIAIALFLFGMFGHKIGRSGGQEIKPKRPNRRLNA